MKCLNCNCNESYVKKYNHKMSIKNKEIIFTSPRRFCNNCNNLVYDKDLDNKASLKGIEIYNQKYGIPKEDIIKLRKEYGLSQELFAKIIGCAKKTLISYEKGKSIPNDNFYITIKSLINNPSIIEEFIQANKNILSENEQEILNKKLVKYLSNNIKRIKSTDNELTKYNGYTELNFEKIKNMILYFSKGGILKTKLLKEMFFADFLNYKNTGASITGLEYVKLPFGPVPDDFDTILNFLREENVIDYKIEFSPNKEYEYHKIISKQEIITDLFEESELENLKTIKEYFKDYKSKDIVDKSHEEKAYLNTKENAKIDYKYALDINIISI